MSKIKPKLGSKVVKADFNEELLQLEKRDLIIDLDSVPNAVRKSGDL